MAIALGVEARQQRRRVVFWRAADLARTLVEARRAKELICYPRLELCTHTPLKGSAIYLYTTFPWEALCEEVLKLKVQRQTSHGEVVHLHALAAAPQETPIEENQTVETPA